MPRPKTVQPEPIEATHLYEVRDETCWKIGRGQHNNLKKWLRIDQILEVVVFEYLNSDGLKIQLGSDKDYMRNASAFAREMEGREFAREDCPDDSSLRKSIYPKVSKRLRAYIDAVEERKNHLSE